MNESRTSFKYSPFEEFFKIPLINIKNKFKTTIHKNFFKLIQSWTVI